jgi:hypothetical protein
LRVDTEEAVARWRETIDALTGALASTASVNLIDGAFGRSKISTPGLDGHHRVVFTGNRIKRLSARGAIKTYAVITIGESVLIFIALSLAVFLLFFLGRRHLSHRRITLALSDLKLIRVLILFAKLVDKNEIVITLLDFEGQRGVDLIEVIVTGDLTRGVTTVTAYIEHSVGR